MKIEIKALTDAELVRACVKYATSGSSFVDSTLAQERQEVGEYYRGKKPYPLREGGSKFVSQDVFEACEGIKAHIVETFAAGSNIVTFNPVGGDDVPLADQATSYCENVVFGQNDGFSIIESVVHDSAQNRIGVAEVYWDKQEVRTSYSLKKVPMEEVVAALQNPQAVLTGKPKEHADGTFSCEYDIVEDTSQTRIDVFPPEEFITAGRFTVLSKAPYRARRSRLPLGDLVDMGYDKDVVYNLSGDAFDDDMDVERQQRLEDTQVQLFDDDAEDAAGKLVTYYKSYIRMDVEGLGYQQLYRVCHVGTTILEKAKVADDPFVIYTMMPIPHTFYGDNFAARTIQHANTKTTLTRAVIEQAVEATNPRWQVARGGISNPRELLDNRRGGIVNVRSVADSIAPLPQTPINPFVLQTISMVDQAREDTTGISRLSQGLDKGALSHQNSQGLVEQLTNNGQTRSKVMARRFAVQFLAPLYLKVYAVGIENDKQRMLDINGSYVEVTPQQWRRRSDVRVDMTLGYGDRGRVAEELLTYDKYMKETGGRLYGETQQHAVIKKVLKVKGHTNVQDFLVDVATLQPPEPDPMQAAELQKAQKEVEMLDREMAIKEARATLEDQIKRAEMALKRDAQNSKVRLAQAEADRKEAETANRIDTSQAELELAIHTAANAPDENTKTSAIISPNG